MVSFEVETIPWGGQVHVVRTSFGLVSIFVCGDQHKPALVTYADVALDYMSCFQGLVLCPEAASLLFNNFCIFHINAPGHELGAATISIGEPNLSMDDLADQVVEVLDYFGLHQVIGMGVTAGAYVLMLVALKYRERVFGLILVSPLCKAPSWKEWFYNEFLINVLYIYGMSSLVKKMLLQRYFSESLNCASSIESDIIRACRRLLDERQSKNVMRFFEAVNRRRDLTEALGKLDCRTLIVVGDQSPFHHEALHISSVMDKRYNALVEVPNCGSLVTEEQPESLLIAMEYFLMGYGFYKPVQLPCLTSTPTTPLSPPCISPELLSPESSGLKLKPIKTRVVQDEEALHSL